MRGVGDCRVEEGWVRDEEVCRTSSSLERNKVCICCVTSGTQTPSLNLTYRHKHKVLRPPFPISLLFPNQWLNPNPQIFPKTKAEAEMGAVY